MIGGVTTGPAPGRRLGLGSLTPSGRAVVPSGWALYDFANTIYSYAVVSYAMGLWLVEDTQFGKANGPFAFSIAIAVSVGINALVSPILGALSERAGVGAPEGGGGARPAGTVGSPWRVCCCAGCAERRYTWTTQ